MTDKTKNEPQGAFGKDKLYGNRLDQAFAAGERFMLLGARIADEVIETELGPANPARLLVQRVDGNDGVVGAAFVATTLASAIVDKIKQLQPGELPALVELRYVDSKYKRGGVPQKALVLQYVGAGDSADELAAEFGLTVDDVDLRQTAGATGGDLPAGY